MRLGRNRGRPKKKTRISIFFDFALTNKRAKNKNIINVRGKRWKERNMQKENNSETELSNKNNPNVGEVRNEKLATAEEILETSKMMGLNSLNNKETTLKIIQEILGTSTHELNQPDDRI